MSRRSASRIAALLSLVALTLLAGCASDDPLDLQELWDNGYGFNNPNAERLKNHQPPEKDGWFDGWF